MVVVDVVFIMELVVDVVAMLVVDVSATL